MSESGGGVTWRIAFSIITSVFWLVFILYWIGFLWGDFEVGQNVASLCISSVVFAGINGLVWTIWPRNKSSD
jgi:hypothetical protein